LIKKGKSTEKENGPDCSGPFLEKKSVGDLAVVLTGTAVLIATAVTVSTSTTTVAAATAAVSTASATTTVAASATTTVATATSSTTRTILHGAGFIDGEVASTHVGATQGRDRCLALFGSAEGDKSESA
jgi:hypothetical protein